MLSDIYFCFALTLDIEYQNEDGIETKRVVNTSGFDNTLNGGLIIGHCELRNGTRTFRFDRIKKCVDVESGEVISNIGDYLNARYNESPARTIEILESEFKDVLKVLLFVAKADGQFRKNERTISKIYLSELAKDDRFTDVMIKKLFQDLTLPSLQGFKIAVGKAVNHPNVDALLLKKCCFDIVHTQKSIHPSEQAALDYLDKKIPA